MTDRILNSAWWAVVMTMICVAGSIGLIVGYHGLFEVLGGRWNIAALHFAISLIGTAGALLLCRHRNDLLF